MSNNYIGNTTTIIKFLSTMLAGWVIAVLASQGLNLTVDTATLAEAIGILIGLGFGYMDAKYPNTFKFLGNNDEILDVDPASEYEEELAGDEDGC